MPFLVIIILALVQGITEFLPISSSGHLVLVHQFFDASKPTENAWRDHMLLDIAVHIGTLFSVLLYFHKDIIEMLLPGIKEKELSSETSQYSLLKYVVIASIPVIIIGYLIHLYEPSWLLQIQVVGWTTLIFGLILGWADRKPILHENLKLMRTSHALIIGFAQTLALVPGVSRAGITMTAARALGYNRPDSAKFSLLLSIIAIGGAGTIGIYELYKSGSLALGLDFFIAAILAFITGLIAIALMMKWLEKATFMPFVIYRIIMGVGLLALAYSGASY